MMNVITYQTQNKSVPTEYYTNKIEFGTKEVSDNKIIFWDNEIQEWIVLDAQEILCIIG